MVTPEPRCRLLSVDIGSRVIAMPFPDINVIDNLFASGLSSSLPTSTISFTCLNARLGHVNASLFTGPGNNGLDLIGFSQSIRLNWFY